MAENELASQQPSRLQPIGLGIPQGAGTAAKYELCRSRRVQNNHLVWAAKAAAAATIFQGQLRNPPPFPGVDLHCINIFTPLVPFKAF